MPANGVDAPLQADWLPGPLRACPGGCDCLAVLPKWVDTCPLLFDDFDITAMGAQFDSEDEVDDTMLQLHLPRFVTAFPAPVLCTLRRAYQLDTDGSGLQSQSQSHAAAASTVDKTPIPWPETLESALFSLYSIRIRLLDIMQAAVAAPLPAALQGSAVAYVAAPVLAAWDAAVASLISHPAATLAAAEAAHLGARSVTSKRPLSPALRNVPAAPVSASAGLLPAVTASMLSRLRAAGTVATAATRLTAAIKQLPRAADLRERVFLAAGSYTAGSPTYTAFIAANDTEDAGALAALATAGDDAGARTDLERMGAMLQVLESAPLRQQLEAYASLKAPGFRAIAPSLAAHIASGASAGAAAGGGGGGTGSRRGSFNLAAMPGSSVAGGGGNGGSNGGGSASPLQRRDSFAGGLPGGVAVGARGEAPALLLPSVDADAAAIAAAERVTMVFVTARRVLAAGLEALERAETVQETRCCPCLRR